MIILVKLKWLLYIKHLLTQIKKIKNLNKYYFHNFMHALANLVTGLSNIIYR